MNGLWKKRIPAFLLTLVMIVSLMPMAMAAPGDDSAQTRETVQEGQEGSSGSGDQGGGTGNEGDNIVTPDPLPPSCNGIHDINNPGPTLQKTVDREATCSLEGSATWTCTACNNFTKVVSILKKAHDYTGKDWVRESDTQHSRTCNNCPYKETQSHRYDPNALAQPAGAEEHTRVCVDCLYVLREKHTHAADDYGKRVGSCEVSGGTNYTCSACKASYTVMEGGNGLSHIDNDVNGFCDRCGVKMFVGFTVTFNTNGGTKIDSQTVPSGTTLSPRISDPSRGVGYTFKGWQRDGSPASLYTGQANLLTSNDVNSTAFNAPATFYAIYQVSVTGQTGSISANASIGNTLWTHISNKAAAYFGTTPESVTFTTLGATSSGVLYVTSSNAAQTGVAYYESSFRNMTFQPGAAGSAAYRLYYTAKDKSGYNSVSGYLDISGQAAGSTITISVAPGKTTWFDATAFQNAYRAAGFSDTLSYVMFPNVSGNYTNFSGKVYNNSTELTAATLSGGTYLSAAGINALSLRAPSSAKNDTFTTTYRAYSSNRVTYAEGTLELRVSGASGNTVTYEVRPGGEVRFDSREFNKAFQAAYGSSSQDLYCVIFSAPSGYSSFRGQIYAGNSAFTLNALNGSNFYYSSRNVSGSTSYSLDQLSVRADSNARNGDSLTIPFRAYSSSNTSNYVNCELIIKIGNGTGKGDIEYDVAPGKTVEFRARDFYDFFRESYSGTFSYVQFDQPSSSTFSQGAVYHNYNTNSSRSFTYSNIDDQRFYYNPGTNDYGIGNLTFVANNNFTDTITLDFVAYGSGNNSVRGTVTIRSTENTDGDVTYTVTPGKSVDLQRTAFNNFFRKKYNSTVSYVVFERPSSTTIFDNGTLYCDYGTNAQTSFSRNSLSGTRFYYNKNDAGTNDYYLDELTFVANSNFRDSITLYFVAYGEYSNEYVEGKLVIKADAAAAITSNYTGSIRYTATTGVNVQINANDIARYFRETYPAYTMQYMTLGGVPAVGSLYYNYYNASSYGTTSRTQLTAANFGGQSFYLSPSSTSQFALTELTYVPSGSNYCASIPFTAYGTGNVSVAGNILISVSRIAVPEVYGVTPRGTAVDFPAASIYSAVLSATGSALSGIQLLSLPVATSGAVYLGTGSTRADTKTMYTYAAGVNQMSLLRFVPTANYTGSVEIPYVALDANGNALATGTFSLGVLNSRKTLKDVDSSTWCYKYVMELTDQNVISGYPDGSFKPNSTVTYGAALKLIMLAAGYPEQAPTGKNVFSGYLAKAQADGIVTRSNVSLTAPITRLQVAQLAAGAMKLSTSGLSSVKPFTDTSDVYVQALNAAGIVEGYFSNGTSTFQPNKTLTRGQMSAIVWRMNEYRK